MRRRVGEHDVARWAVGFLDTLGRVASGATRSAGWPAQTTILARWLAETTVSAGFPAETARPHLGVEPEIS